MIILTQKNFDFESKILCDPLVVVVDDLFIRIKKIVAKLWMKASIPREGNKIKLHYLKLKSLIVAKWMKDEEVWLPHWLTDRRTDICDCIKKIFWVDTLPNSNLWNSARWTCVLRYIFIIFVVFSTWLQILGRGSKKQ